MNKVILLGRLTRDPETRYSNSAEPLAITRYSLAVNRKFKRDGEQSADFINIVAFGKAGEFAQKFFVKGQQVGVSGRLSTGSYDDKDGKKVYTTEVVVEDQYFADSKAAGAGGGGDYQAPRQTQAAPKAADDFFAISDTLDDEDLPF